MDEHDLIKQAGLTRGESKVYLTLLEIGSSSTGPIIDKSQIAKSCIYKILQNLLEHGLVSITSKDNIKYYQTTSPSRIMDYITKKQVELEDKRKEMEKLLPKLLEMENMSSKSEVSMYQGFKGVQTCFDKYEQKLKGGDEYLCLGLFAEQSEKYHAYWNKHHTLRVKQKIKARMLFNADTKKDVLQNRNSYAGCDSRYMPTKIVTPAWIYVYADTCVIFMQSPNQFAIEIINQDVADTFRAYFEDYWRLSVAFESE